jgi:hypothetical protein
VENENNDKKMESLYSKRLRAGKRRTYFFDVRSTKGNDYYLTITESRKRFDDNGYDRHKVFLYKEDFNKFIKSLTEAIDFVKTDLMPDFNFDAFNHDEYDDEAAPVQKVVVDTPEASSASEAIEQPEPPQVSSVEEAPKADENNEVPPSAAHEEVDKW